MSFVPIMMMMAANNHHRNEMHRRRMEEERRRRQREEEQRKKRKREEEERRKEEEHRKTAPVVFNNEQWQQDRCLKAFSMQPEVKKMLSLIEKVRPIIIQREQQRFDERIIDVGYEYEVIRQELEDEIKTLKESGVSIEGRQYHLTRLSPINTQIARPEKVDEYLGKTFVVANGQPITLNTDILASDRYYEDRYEEMDPVETERDFTETSKKMRRYQKFGKFLKFLLQTEKYYDLEYHSEMITQKHEKCELRKKEMESFQTLSKEQLLVIKSYFTHLSQLLQVSTKIEDLFSKKSSLTSSTNEIIYDQAIREILANEEYSELIEQIKTYISKMESNDEQTMSEAYGLVKGEYPINIFNRFIYKLLFDRVRQYSKEKQKTLKLT